MGFEQQAGQEYSCSSIDRLLLFCDLAILYKDGIFSTMDICRFSHVLFADLHISRLFLIGMWYNKQQKYIIKH